MYEALGPRKRVGFPSVFCILNSVFSFLTFFQLIGLKGVPSYLLAILQERSIPAITAKTLFLRLLIMVI
jgi:hypothetical protein